MKKFTVSFAFKGDLAKLGTLLRLIENEKKITFLKLPTLVPDASSTFSLELAPSTIMFSSEVKN